MRRFTSCTLALATALTVAGLGAGPAAASCAEPIPLDQALAEASHVFVGTVVELRFDDRFAVFDVEDVWKGELPEQVQVNGGPRLAELESAAAEGLGVATSVDRTYTLGERYLVVSSGLDEGALTDNICSATRPFDDGLADARPADAHGPDPTLTAIPGSDEPDTDAPDAVDVDEPVAPDEPDEPVDAPPPDEPDEGADDPDTLVQPSDADDADDADDDSNAALWWIAAAAIAVAAGGAIAFWRHRTT